MKTVIKIFLMLLFSVMSFAGIYAQRTVTGTVLDQERQPVPGANIIVKQTDIGTISDADGKFTITVPSTGGTLVVSFVGYSKQEIEIGNQTVINVVLQSTAMTLDEVVVVGYGTQKKASVAGAVSTMKAEDVRNIPVPKLSNALGGRLSGVFVEQGYGAPGYAASIRIRSINTWKSSGLDPLYVIDGILTDKRAFDALDYSEVENITVLKDAASGAIYGARAANGVILVTTRKGSPGRFTLNYNYSYSFDRPSKIPEYVDAKDMVRLENYGLTSEGLAPLYDDEEVAFFNENDPGRQWYELAYQDPTLQRHAVTASGGTDRVKYFLSGSFFDQTAFIKNADYQKYNLRSNIDVNFTKNLSGVFNVSYSQGTKTRFVMQEDNLGFDANPNFGNLWGRLLYYLPQIPPKTSDGKFINPGWIGNMLAFIEEGGTNTRVERNVDMILGLKYNVPFVDGLSLSTNFSPRYAGMTMKQYELKTTLYNVKRLGTHGWIYTDEVTGTIKSSYPNKERMAMIQDGTKAYQLNFAANYLKSFGKHNIDAVVVYEQSEGDYEYFYGVREGFPLIQKDQFWATSTARADSYVDGIESETGRASYIGRVAYNYDEKYILNATLRRDGSMLFAPDKRWGTFPSVSAGWIISRENFFNVNWIDDLRIRTAWGLSGNDAVGGWKWQESYSVVGDFLMGTMASPRVRYGGIVNPNLTWEKTSEINIGLDARMFKGLVFGIELYKRHNYDILDSRILSIPVSFGGTMPPENYGEVDGKGIEIELGYTGNAGDFHYSVMGNFGYSTNEVIIKDVAENIRDVDNPIGRSTDYMAMLVYTDIIRTQADLDALPEGYTIYGIKPRLGMLNFEDVSGVEPGVPDGKIDDYDRQVIKGAHSVAPFMAGLNVSLSWKGFSFDCLLQGLAGINKLYNDGHGRRFTVGGRMPVHWLDSWSEDNIDAEYPKPTQWDWSRDHLASTFWMRDASYLRLQYLNLSYSLPKSLLKRINVGDVTLILSGTNLFTLTKFPWFDPSGAEMRSYPTMKSYTLGANITF